MAASIAFFPVGNGDMTLITTDSGQRVLIDINIRAKPDTDDEPCPDVLRELKERLNGDEQSGYAVDAMLLSHPDQDHCRGLRDHFYLGPADKWSPESGKILVRELWSSPMVFRRASKRNLLCDDARAFNAEARRRVRRYRAARDAGQSVAEGDRILILGEDDDGRTDDLHSILVSVGELVERINRQPDSSLSARLLGPLPSEDADEDEKLSKNNSSTILRFSLSGGGLPDKCRFLTGGDARVEIWERLWDEYGGNRSDWLSYDILLAPHHCSWHTLSHDSWSGSGGKARASEEALRALSQTRSGANIVASSKPIKDDEDDPPCVGAKREYEKITQKCDGTFRCVGERPSEHSPAVMEFEISASGWRVKVIAVTSAAIIGAGFARQPYAHG